MVDPGGRYLSGTFRLMFFTRRKDMTCDLAVSIAKAAVTEEHLRTLLTPEIVKQVTLTYLQQQYARYNPEMLYTSDLTVGFCVGTCDLEIAQGQVTVTDVDGNTTFAEQLSTALV